MRRTAGLLVVLAAPFAAPKADAHFYAGCKHNPCKRHVVKPFRPWLKKVAWCESTNNPRAVSPGGRYRGLYQFAISTWYSVGGYGDPAAASRLEQSYRAVVLRWHSGTSPWPVCG